MLPPSTRRLVPASAWTRRSIAARYNYTYTPHSPSSTRAPPPPATDTAHHPHPTEQPPPPASSTSALPTLAPAAHDAAVAPREAAEDQRVLQAPNRAGTWSRSQQPRAKAMVGPRFEQTVMADQPRPFAAIDLIHQQPVRWTTERVVACDGGGGPLGHPRIFINLDKPQICWCTYCGLPFAHEHHREHLQRLPSTSYPLEPTGHAAQIPAADAESERGGLARQRG